MGNISDKKAIDSTLKSALDPIMEFRSSATCICSRQYSATLANTFTAKRCTALTSETEMMYCS